MRSAGVFFILIPMLLTLSCSRGTKDADPSSAAQNTAGATSENSVPPMKAFVQPKTVMHRTKAGEADESGWYTARSTEGNYEVRLPSPFNDFTVSANAEDGADTKTFIVGTVNPKGVQFTALAARRADGIFKEDPLISSAESFQKRGSLKAKQSITFAGMPATEITVANINSSAFLRVLKTRDTVYQLSVECFPPTNLDDVGADAKRFFASLKVYQKDH